MTLCLSDNVFSSIWDGAVNDDSKIAAAAIATQILIESQMCYFFDSATSSTFTSNSAPCSVPNLTALPKLLSKPRPKPS